MKLKIVCFCIAIATGIRRYILVVYYKSTHIIYDSVTLQPQIINNILSFYDM